MVTVTLDPASDRYRIRFYYAEVQYHRSIKTKDENKARRILLRVEETIQFLEQGRIVIPPEAARILSSFIELLQSSHSKPTVKQNLATIRMLFDWLVTGQVVPVNPATSVRGPKHVVDRGPTPVLSAEETRALFESIKPESVGDKRDRALLAAMFFTFARVGTVVAMSVKGYHPQGKRYWLRLQEKNGKQHEMPTHHTLEANLDAYLHAAGIADDGKAPLFRTAARTGDALTSKPMRPADVWRMIQRRAEKAGIPTRICCHSFRATGITNYLQHNGTLEKAQQMASQASPRTTKLSDQTNDQITLDEVEKIML